MEKLIRPLATMLVVMLLAAGGGLYRNSRTEETDTYRVTAYFEKAIGLFPNSDVDVLGVPVGTILSVDPVGERVKVEMEISAEHKIPADATAHIIPPSVISDRYIQLEPPYEEGPVLEDGAVIEVGRTQIPAELDDVFKQLKKLLKAFEPGEEGDPGALGELIIALDKSLSGREDDLRGTLKNAAKLTRTLAGAEEDISGLLINLDDFFEVLATRAGKFGSLNRNLREVLDTIGDNRTQIRGALVSLADLTQEVADLVSDHRGRIGEDLRLATRITSTLLENRASVEESLVWLPVVAQALYNARHNGPVDAIDVRDNLNAKMECEDLEPIFDLIPDDNPLEQLLREECLAFTGEPEPEPSSSPSPAPPAVEESPEPPVEVPELELDCDKGVRKVRRQIDRIVATGLTDEVKDEIIDPLKKQIRKIKKKCREVGEALEDTPLEDRLKELLEQLPEIGVAPDVDETLEDLDDLTGNAAGDDIAPVPSEPSAMDRIGSFFGGFFDFVGVGS